MTMSTELLSASRQSNRPYLKGILHRLDCICCELQKQQHPPHQIFICSHLLTCIYLIICVHRPNHRKLRVAIEGLKGTPTYTTCRQLMTAHNTLWLRISKLIDSVASCTKSEEYDEHILECHQLYCDVVNYLTGEGITFGDYSEPRSSTEVLTNTLIETLIDPNNWVARGKVVDEKGDGIEGLVVSLYDQDHLFDDQLGTTQTDTSGQFLITYTTQDFRNLFEGNPDLYIKVVDQQDNILYSSESAVNAGAGRVENFGNININRPGSGE